MKTITITALLSLMCFTASAEVHTLDKAREAKTRSLNPEYLVFAPKTKSSQDLPLLIYLHGGGGKGTDVRRIESQTRALRMGIDRFGKGPCIVVAPQTLKQTKDGESGVWFPEDLNVLLEALKATLPVDENRVYLTGNSMGGYGSWVWGGTNPEHFAAIAPVVGGIGRNGPKDVTPNLDQWAKNLASVPLWAFAGAQDKVVPAERSERVVNAIKKTGGKLARLTIYPDEGHGARRRVYEDKAFYDWMFSQRRK